MIDRHKIAVVYLSWLPYGIKHFQNFIESYILNTPDSDHDLIIAFNGLAKKHSEPLKNYLDILADKNIHAKTISFKSGQDLDIYDQIAKSEKYSFFLFLNTYSIIQNSKWLEIFRNSISPEIGIIGATGSFSSYLTAINRKTYVDLFSSNTFSSKYNSLKYFLKLNLIYGRFFKHFPNPHIRTNAFLIKRELFLKITKPQFNSKIDAYIFENGKNSMTNQLLGMGLRCVVVNSNMKVFDVMEWKNANVFWQNQQEYLLISDNQTRKYDTATLSIKRDLNKDAWNK